MEIEFNPSRVPKRDFAEPVTRTSAPPATSAAGSSAAAASLMSKLNDIPMARPAQVERAKELVASEEYPPGWLLERIAILLGNQLQK
jgi:hypothetical protein